MKKSAGGNFEIITPWDGESCEVRIRCACPYCGVRAMDFLPFSVRIEDGDHFRTDLTCQDCGNVIDVEL